VVPAGVGAIEPIDASTTPTGLVPTLTVTAPAPVAPTMGFNAIAATVIAGQAVTISGWADPGTRWVWNATDRVYDDYPAVTYTGVRLTLDTGQIFNAASADASWSSWSSNAVVFPAAGSHPATATASTREGPVVSAGP